MRIQAAVCAIYVLLGIGQSRADSYPPYQDQRTIDPKGKYYVVIERAGAAIHDLPWGPVKITVAEAREGSTPVRQAKCRVIDRDGRFETIRNEAIAVRSGDLVHGRIELTNAPQHVLVSANGLGLITLGIYGPNYNALKDGAAVSVYDLTGKVRHSLSLEELLGPGSLERYFNGSGSVWWMDGAWIDEKERELVIIGSKYKVGAENRQIVVVNLERGVVRNGGRNDLARAIESKNPAALAVALDFVADEKINVDKQQLIAIVDDEQIQLTARLRASVILSSVGHKDGARLVRESCLTARKEQLDFKSPEYDEQMCTAAEYAIAHVPDVLGEAGMPLLKSVVQKYGYQVVAIQAFSRYGEKAVRTLISMVEYPESPDVQYVGVEALTEIGPNAQLAVPSLVKALENTKATSGGLKVSAGAASALGAIGRAAVSALPALQGLSRSDDAEIRASAIEAIKKIRSEK